MSEQIPFTKEHENRLTRIESIVSEHSSVLAQHTVILNQHSAKLDEHSAKLDEHSSRMDEGFRRVHVLLEDQRSTLNTVLEIVTHINERYTRVDTMEAKLQNHDNRIGAIECFLGKDA